ncbi:unnamed protein product [Bursaphelenchus xylophilus]|uniref:(pine wood nematode) hypothetical protein n=1 Tax=Bursaphelenchus xylophilus TaxID=6326 RepID=A0A1I7SGD3_BURXY|nr:unnamed protein product [Bursaphelenchus xylophilus]CAG9102091.1 unnamed protein product [Bursaphelenchus xylophilus]
MLTWFNDLLPERHRLSESQLNDVFEAYQHTVTCFNGLPGVGKSQTMVFIASYNWIFLRRTTVCYSTRNNAALEITKRHTDNCPDWPLCLPQPPFPGLCPLDQPQIPQSVLIIFPANL